MTCPVGKLLSYSFTSHVLEERTDTCVTPNKCVDYVHVTFPDSSDEETTCGQEPGNAVFADGYSALKVEFYANRHEESAGFYMTVTCSTPSTPPPMGKRQTAESKECSRVSDAERPTVDGGAQLVSLSYFMAFPSWA